MLNIPGCDLKNIFVLREYAHAQNVHSKLKTAEHVVVLGLSFISMESAAYCNDKCASVTIVGRDIVPLRSIFGIEIGERIQKEFEAKGNYVKIVTCVIYVSPPDDNNRFLQV
jgi:NADPH-dependent 2,4-dienoyl-CoA reductase/sulfur reductase-like enzyme